MSAPPPWSFAKVVAALVVCALASSPALLGPADPVGADAAWHWAMAESGGDVAHPAFVDAAEAAAKLRPWHPGYAEARERLRSVAWARLHR